MNVKSNAALTANLYNNKGFSLIEMAIVLVIIGLLVGGILKGQELISGSKVKAAIYQINGIVAAYNGYLDRYHAIPGDDGGGTAGVASRGKSWTNVPSGYNKGYLYGADNSTVFNPSPANSESVYFWQHLKAAGFIPGDPTATSVATGLLPQNPFGGLLGVGLGSASINGMSGTALSVCLGRVPGKAAIQIDMQLDDGKPDSGTVRGSTGGNNTPPAATAAASYSEDNEYTVCVAM
jgi:prepilin-type N-terminal cleavage/methylation domain-containing protein